MKDAPANVETPVDLPIDPEDAALPDGGTITTGGEPETKADELADAALTDAERIIADSKAKLVGQRDSLNADLEQAKADKIAAQSRINAARAALVNVERVLGSFEPRKVTRTVKKAAGK